MNNRIREAIEMLEGTDVDKLANDILQRSLTAYQREYLEGVRQVLMLKLKGCNNASDFFLFLYVHDRKGMRKWIEEVCGYQVYTSQVSEYLQDHIIKVTVKIVAGEYIDN